MVTAIYLGGCAVNLGVLPLLFRLDAKFRYDVSDEATMVVCVALWPLAWVICVLDYGDRMMRWLRPKGASAKRYIMPTVECAECSSPLSPKARYCPRCGHAVVNLAVEVLGRAVRSERSGGRLPIERTSS